MTDLSLTDQANIELDTRKVQQLVDDGIITPEEILNAPIECWTAACSCPNGDSDKDDRCVHCGTPYVRDKD